MNLIIFLICILAASLSGIFFEKICNILHDLPFRGDLYKVNPIIFRNGSLSDIESNIMPSLKQILKSQKGKLRVYDMYLICNMQNKDDRNYIYGWNSLKGFEIALKKDVGYYLKFPDPILLEKKSATLMVEQ